MSFLPLFPSRFEMRSSNSDKKLSLDSYIPTGYTVFHTLWVDALRAIMYTKKIKLIV